MQLLTVLRKIHRQPRGTATSFGLPIIYAIIAWVERQRGVHIGQRGTHPDGWSDLLRVIPLLIRYYDMDIGPAFRFRYQKRACI